MEIETSLKRGSEKKSNSVQMKRSKIKCTDLPPGVPEDHLPVWTTLPLYAKLPMVPGPKNSVVLYTTHLGERIHHGCEDIEFDLTDPYSLLMSNKYRELHDPHLKPHLTTPQMRRRLYREGFITRDGRVVCTLKEFNEYRQYLRKINLALENQTKRRAKSAGSRRTNRKECVLTQALIKQREEKVKEVRERLHKQYEEDRARYQSLMQEEEERTKRILINQKEKMKVREEEQRKLQDHRMKLIRDKQRQERSRKNKLMDKWITDDIHRNQVAESKRKERQKERQQKLVELWELRKWIQQEQLDEKERIQKDQERQKQQRIAHRELLVQRQRERQQAIFMEMITHRRKEKEELEKEYTKRFEERMQRRRERMAAKRRHRKKKPTHKDRRHLKSNWDIEEVLLKSMSDEEYGEMTDEKRKTLSCGDLMRLTSDQSADRAKRSSIEQLGLGDFKDAAFTDDVIDAARRTSRLEVSSIGRMDLSEFHGAVPAAPPQLVIFDDEGTMVDTDVVEGDFSEFHGAELPMVKDDQKQRSHFFRFCQSLQTEKDYQRHGGRLTEKCVAKAIVALNTYLATQVINPALERMEEFYDSIEPYPRPASPDLITPDRDDQIFESESDIENLEEALGVYLQDGDVAERVGSRGVRFSIVTEVIAVTDQSSAQIMPDWMKQDMPIDEEEESSEDEDQVENPIKPIKLEGKDSLTRLRTKSGSSLFITAEDAPEAVRDLSSLLVQIVDQHRSGNLQADRIQELVMLAQQILSSSPQGGVDGGKALVEDTASDSSFIADEVVQLCIEKIQRELFEQDEARRQEEQLKQAELDEEMKETIPSRIESLANFIVHQALKMVVESLYSAATTVRSSLSGHDMGMVTDRSTDTSSSGKSGLSSTSGTSDYIRSVIQKCANSLQSPPVYQFPSSSDSDSLRTEASEYVGDLLNRVLAEVQEDIHQQMPKFLTPVTSLVNTTLAKIIAEINAQQQEVRPHSTESELVADTLSHALSSLREGAVPANLSWDESKPLEPCASDASSTSIFIRATLNNVIREMQKDIPAPKKQSTMSLFAEELVKSTINSCLESIQAGTMPKKSLTELAVAIISIQREDLQDRTVSARALSTSSRHSRDDIIQSGATPEKSLTDLPAPIISTKRGDSRDAISDVDSVRALSATSSLQSSDEIPLGQSASALVDSLIMQTLEKVRQELSEGGLKAEDILSRPNSQSPEFRRFRSETALSRTESRLAEGVVEETFDSIMNELTGGGLTSALFCEASRTILSRTSFHATPPRSRTSMVDSDSISSGELSDLISSVITKVTKDLQEGNIKEGEIHEINDTLQSSMTNVSTNAHSETPDKRDTPDSMSETQENNVPDDPPSAANTVSDSDGDVELIPCLGELPVQMEKEVVSNALYAISVRDPNTLTCGLDLVERNSFRSLIRPDVSHCSTLNTDSEKSLKEALTVASSKQLSLTPAEIAQASAPSVAHLKSLRTVSTSGMLVASQRQQAMQAIEDEDSSEDEDEEEGERLLNVIDRDGPAAPSRTFISKQGLSRNTLSLQTIPSPLSVESKTSPLAKSKTATSTQNVAGTSNTSLKRDSTSRQSVASKQSPSKTLSKPSTSSQKSMTKVDRKPSTVSQSGKKSALRKHSSITTATGVYLSGKSSTSLQGHASSNKIAPKTSANVISSSKTLATASSLGKISPTKPVRKVSSPSKIVSASTIPPSTSEKQEQSSSSTEDQPVSPKESKTNNSSKGLKKCGAIVDDSRTTSAGSPTSSCTSLDITPFEFEMGTSHMNIKSPTVVAVSKSSSKNSNDHSSIASSMEDLQETGGSSTISPSTSPEIPEEIIVGNGRVAKNFSRRKLSDQTNNNKAKHVTKKKTSLDSYTSINTSGTRKKDSGHKSMDLTPRPSSAFKVNHVSLVSTSGTPLKSKASRVGQKIATSCSQIAQGQNQAQHTDRPAFVQSDTESMTNLPLMNQQSPYQTDSNTTADSSIHSGSEVELQKKRSTSHLEARHAILLSTSESDAKYTMSDSEKPRPCLPSDVTLHPRHVTSHSSNGGSSLKGSVGGKTFKTSSQVSPGNHK